VLRRPACYRAHLAQHLPGRQRERLDLGEVCARRRLLAAERGEPDVIPFERLEQRAHFVTRAAGVGVGLPQPGTGLGGLQVHEIQLPAAGQLVAVGIRLREVVEGVQEEHGDVGPDLAQHVDEHHAFGLEARRDARLFCRRQLPGGNAQSVVHVSISSRARRTASIASASLPAARAARARRSAAPRRAIGLTWSRAALTIIPAPAVKFVAGSITMKLPVPRSWSYGSKTIGRAVVTATRPIWFSTRPRLTSAETMRV